MTVPVFMTVVMTVLIALLDSAVRRLGRWYAGLLVDRRGLVRAQSVMARGATLGAIWINLHGGEYIANHA